LINFTFYLIFVTFFNLIHILVNCFNDAKEILIVKNIKNIVYHQNLSKILNLKSNRVLELLTIFFNKYIITIHI